MKSIQLSTYLSAVKARKAALCFDESADAVDVRRNKGGRRSARKREILANAADRAATAGTGKVISY